MATAMPGVGEGLRDGTRDEKTMGGRLLGWSGAAVVVLAAIAASANTLVNGFVYDDNANILRNPWIRDLALLGRAFESHVAAFDPNTNTSFYRPFMHVINAASYALFGFRALGFHAVNLAFHAAVSLCVFVLLRRCCGRMSSSTRNLPRPALRQGTGALIGAVLFAVHPIHTEPVAWLAGITDLSYTLFVLLSLLAATSPGTSRATRLVVAPALFFISMLCKEPAVVLLPVLGVAIATRADLADSSRRRTALVQLSTFLAAGVLYFVLRARALGGFAGSDRRVEASAWEGIATGIALLGEYLRKLIIPTNLSPMHDFQLVNSWIDQRLWVGIVALAVIAAGAVRFARNPEVMLGLSLLVLPLLPTLYLPALGEGLFAERYLYLPSAGAALLVALAFDSLAAHSTVRRIAAVASAAAALAYAYSTFDRNAVWRSDLSLWEDTAPKVPRRASAQEALGTALYFAGRHGDAVVALARATELDPRFTDARVNLAASLCALGRVDEAMGQLDIALSRRPGHPEGLSVLGWALMAQGRVMEGIAAYENALAIKPMLPTAHNALGIAYAQLGDRDRAAWHFREAIRLDPDNPGYAHNLDVLGR